MGDQIYIKLLAENVYGKSELSLRDGTSVVVIKPDPPKNLIQGTTSAQQISFSWSDGTSNGGMQIIDYSVYYLNEEEEFVVLDTVQSNSFQTLMKLVPDQSYQFKVTARNSVGSSELSQLITIIAGEVPSAPEQLTNDKVNTNAYQIALKWAQLEDGGSPILYYQISYIFSGKSQYQVIQSNVYINETIVTGLTPGVTYRFIVQAKNRIGLSEQSTSVAILAAQTPDPPISFINEPELTGKYQIGLSWETPSFQGGAQLIDYRIWCDQANGTFEVLAQNIMALNFTATSLITGLQYQFKVQARNAIGYSSFSETLMIITARVPGQPQAPLTSFIDDSIVIDWEAPDDNGSPITSYTILIRQEDLTFSTELKNCYGIEKRVREATSCTIPVSVLRALPFSLEWGSNVHAKVIATNLFGNSGVSLVGNGAIMLTKPSPPVIFVEDTSLRTKSSLGLVWSQNKFTGGSPVLDYRISMSQGGLYFIIASNLTNLTYTATGLTPGLTYQFVAESRTLYGYSQYSTVLILACAYKPEAPSVVTTTNSGNNIAIQWSSTITNGSPITGYKVLIKQANPSQIYLQETSECQGSAMMTNRVCYVSLAVLQAEPYNLAAGETISVKVIASNQYGDSPQAIADGGVVYSIPDAPIGLENDQSITTDSVIKIKWSDGASDGGSPILNYSVVYDQGNGVWVQIASGVTDQFYVTGVTLTANTVYQFKVSAQNQVGVSLMSTTLNVRAAAIPASPTKIKNVLTLTNATQVGLDWSSLNSEVQYSGGSPIIDYRISYSIQSISGNRRLRRLQEYQVYKSGITTDSYTVTGLTPGYKYGFVLQARNLVGFSAYSEPVMIQAAQIPDGPTLLQKNQDQTWGNKIVINWQAPEFNGGSSITSYKIMVNKDGQSLWEWADDTTDLQWSMNSATNGITYRFKVQAGNALGYSEFSNILTILAAETPAKPQAPTSVWTQDVVTVSWQAPDNGGSPLTSYTILIRQSDQATYSEESQCSGSLITSCSINVNKLRSSPYTLAWGSEVLAKVIASNIYGDSPDSAKGGGAILITNPDPPIQLREEISSRTASTLGIVWDSPDFTGGVEILDYRISYQTGSGQFKTLAQNLATQSYIVTGLITGQTYRFRIEARNKYGYSTTNSEPLLLLCAYRPDTPTNVVTNNLRTKVVVSWQSPQSNGSPITGYQVFIRQHSSQTYAQLSECQETSCQINPSTLSQAPFNLVKGEIIYAKVLSQNLYGNSVYSDSGTGAIMILVADAPINLQNDITVTSDTMIKFTWQQGLSNGGAQVIDYQIYYDQGGSGYNQISTQQSTSYETDFQLVDGVDHGFKVTARNQIGESTQSQEIQFVVSSGDFYTALIVANQTSSDGDDNGVVTGVTVAAAATTGVVGISLIGLLVAIFVTAILIVCCSFMVIFILYRKFRVHPNSNQTPVDIEKISNTDISRNNLMMTPAKELNFTKQKFDTNDKLQLPNESQQINLKGKSLREKRALLNELQKQQEKEITTQFKMERQQLRHDEIQANRRVQEQDRLEEVFKAILGEPQDQAVTQHFNEPRASDLQMLSPTKAKVDLSNLEQEIYDDSLNIDNKKDDQEFTAEPLFVKRLQGTQVGSYEEENLGIFNISQTDFKSFKAKAQKSNVDDIVNEFRTIIVETRYKDDINNVMDSEQESRK